MPLRSVSMTSCNFSLDVVHHRIEVVAFELLLALLAQAFKQVAQARSVLSLVVVNATLKEAAERALRVAVLKNVVRDGVHEVVGVHVEHLLAAVPTVVSVGGHSNISSDPVRDIQHRRDIRHWLLAMIHQV